MVVFGLCWAPFHVDRLMWSCMDVSSEHHLRLFELVHIVSGVFFYLSSAVNPILYNLMSTRFREMFSHVVCYAKERSAGADDAAQHAEREDPQQHQVRPAFKPIPSPVPDQLISYTVNANISTHQPAC